MSSAEEPIPAAAPQAPGGAFTEGSTLRHVIVMSATGAAGLVAVFLVDLANLFYISLLGQQNLAAAVGYAATIIFFTISLSIGFTIAATAVTARAIGAGDLKAAHANATSSLVFTIVALAVLSAIMYPLNGSLLSMMGASGETHAIALSFMNIVVPSIPLLGAGMCGAGLLRAQGDARRAMYVTLFSGFSAAIIDPILIFGAGLGVDGAAYATVIVRAIMVMTALNGLIRVHAMLAPPDIERMQRLLRPFSVIALPAVLTQVATPVGNAYVTAAISEFGDDAVAGWAIIGRLVPLAFAGIFALSGAIGPILSQNLGARKFGRVNQAMRDALIVTAVYTFAMWAVLALSSGLIETVFGAKGDAADLIGFFCHFVAASFMFNGALFVANAAFNNLGQPLLSTVFNWGRATLGVIPFVHYGAAFGPQGVLAGWGLGAVVFGVLSVAVCFRSLNQLPTRKL